MSDETTPRDAPTGGAEEPAVEPARRPLDEPLTAAVWEVPEPDDDVTDETGDGAGRTGDEVGDDRTGDDGGGDPDDPGAAVLPLDDGAAQRLFDPDTEPTSQDAVDELTAVDEAETSDAVADAVLDADPAGDTAVLDDTAPSDDVAPDSTALSDDVVPDDALAEDLPDDVTLDDVIPDGLPADAASDVTPDDATPEDVLDDGAPQVIAAGSPGGWTALGQALRPQVTKAQVLAGVLCAVVGFALVVQVQQNGDTSLEGMRQADLVRMLDETTDRGDALARQESDLAAERDELLSGSDKRTAALDALRRTATTQGILTGRLPAQGPGVVVTISEPDGAVRPLTMLDVLEELRNAGAEAIQLNDRRVTASSAFTGTAGAVVLDGATLSAPFTWIAIGDADTIATALQIPGGAMAAVRNDGGSSTIERSELVHVDAVRVVPDPVYATPVPVPTG